MQSTFFFLYTILANYTPSYDSNTQNLPSSFFFSFFFFFFNYTRFIVLIVSFLSSYKVIRFIPSFVCSSFAQTWIILIFEKFRFNRYLSNIDLRIEQGGSFSLEFHFCANISSSFFDWLLKLIFHRIILSISFLYI